MDTTILQEVLTLVEKYGVSTAIIIILVVLLISMFKSKHFIDLTVKFFTKIIDNLFNKRSDRFSDNTDGKDIEVKNIKLIEITENDVLNHEIFNHIDFWLYSQIPTIEFSTNYRTIVFRKYLHIYFKTYKEMIREYVQKGDYKNMSDSQLRASFMKLLSDIIYKYETDMFMNNIPHIVINKMKIKNNDTLSLTLDLINSICDSPFYNTERNFLKVFSLLSIILSILENAVANSSNVCNGINGDLKGLSMDGFTEGED